MKTMKHFAVTIIILLMSITVSSQENKKVRGDTARVKTQNYLLEVATFDLKNNTLKNADIQNKISDLLGVLGNLDIDTPAEGERISVSYSGYLKGEELDFKQLVLKSETLNSKTLMVRDGNLLETDFGQYVLKVEDKNYCISLYAENLEKIDVNSTEFKELLQKADSEIPENRKKTNVWLIQDEDKNLNSYFLNEVPPYTLDMLELSAGITSGLVKNQFVTGFSARVGLAFAKKGIMKNKYFAEYELLYDFSNPPSNKPFALNNFLSVGYSRNFSLNPNKDKWYGFSVGYLIKRNNDFFDKNTVRLSIHKQISNSITIKPEVYIGDNIMPGLKVSIDF